tara:strand:- start:99 stop:257 length:159 start_codon:yes stop_codon:yes gene_type:complete
MECYNRFTQKLKKPALAGFFIILALSPPNKKMSEVLHTKALKKILFGAYIIF